jgi:hypothetical protein
MTKKTPTTTTTTATATMAAETKNKKRVEKKAALFMTRPSINEVRTSLESVPQCGGSKRA